ncbi:MAG: hypothetical protein IT159_08310 [Bryobacterales bacterium]|nr:hypothetical protein [Bryobacterales bacterium]
MSKALLSRWLVPCLVAALLAAAPAPCQAPAPPVYTITTVAGNGSAGFSGDEEAASAAQVFSPWGLFLDGAGNLFIADQLNNRVRKITPDGKITTVAGDGTASFYGDKEAATAAALNHPVGLAVDSAGYIYFSDAGNHRIRKVTPAGAIDTIAGDGTAAFRDTDDTVDEDQDGNPANEDATFAQMNRPLGIALDSAGNLYIADSYNHRIRKLGTNGKLSTVAGDGTAGRGGDGGPATKAQLNYPQGVAVTPSGVLYIADTSNGLIRRVDTDGTITRVAGIGLNGYSGDGGPALQAGLDYPKSVALDAAGNIYIVDSLAGRVRVITTDGIIHTIAGNGTYGDGGDGGPATRAPLKFPSGLALAAGGAIYVSDTQNNRVRLLTPAQQQPGTRGAPAIHEGGVVSASSFGAFREVAPGSWIEIYGTNLSASARAWQTADFSGMRAPTSLEGTRVTVGGLPAFLSYVSPMQINALVPSNVAPGRQDLRVFTAAGSSPAYPVTVRATLPGLYAPPTFILGGRQYAAALFAGAMAFAVPPGAIPGVVSRKARPGDTLVLYGVGFGSVSPDVPPGEIAPAANSLNQRLEVRIGGAPAAVTYAGLAPGSIGVYQLNVAVPAVAAGDAVPLTFTLDGIPGAQTLYTAIEN